MSEKSSALIKPARFCGALALGMAAAAACMGACAAVMAKQGLARGFAWPLATFSACAGSLLGGWLLAALQKRRGLLCGAALGAALALAVLLAQGVCGSTPDYKQLFRAALIALSGALGGLAHTLAATKARKTH